ncbi:YbgI/family dinuclear metal center protein [Exophiala xenobiotica]|uniref:YbgI/family dinuclear metal center protein n=1 Tax=Exophiala xenobiotica TaxID=348802 RepID=A0A0D2CL70_9EURO|nr:YbgI/family dinuclear metal center protein [Exophiala xenobiotica]KIW50557.1 YbgI/family dinuclear metal center protein [Exophiala xenobiotica]
MCLKPLSAGRPRPLMLRHLLSQALSRTQPCTVGSFITIRNMSTTNTYNVSPFTTAVVSSMRRLYPESLADKSFDNTGFLVQAPFLSSRPRNRNSVLLTVDLTRAVADEAIENNYSIVVSYHPIIFRGLKSITTEDTQQLSMTLLLAHGISVYCPHTAVDTVPNGMADWLCDIITGKTDVPEEHAHTATPSSPTSETEVTTSDESEKDSDHSRPSTKPTSPSAAGQDDPFTSTDTPKPKNLRMFRQNAPHPHRTYSKPTYPRPTSSFHPAVLSHDRSVITPSPRSALDEANQFVASDIYKTSNTGAGRLIEFAEPQPLTVLITRIAHAIGLPKGFAVAIPQGRTIEDINISSVATCPGSGGGVIRGCHADLVFTGELSHHEALAVTERGGCVISLFHSNSERGYLWTVMRERLENEVREEWDRVRTEEGSKSGLEKEAKEMLDDGSVEVAMSERDRDPYGIVVLEEAAVEGVRIGSGSGLSE